MRNAPHTMGGQPQAKVDEDMARETVADSEVIRDKNHRGVSLRQIEINKRHMQPVFDTVCAVFKVDPALAISRSRERIYTAPRRVFARLMVGKRWTLRDIGRFLGGRDHSTIINSINRHYEYMSSGDTHPESVEYRRLFNICKDTLTHQPIGFKHPEGMHIARARSVNLSPYIYAGTKC